MIQCFWMDCTKTWQCSLIFIYVAILISLEVLILWWRSPLPAISLAGWLLIDDPPDCNKRLPFPVAVPLISSDVLQRVSCCSHCLWHHKAGENKFQLTLNKESRCSFRIVFFFYIYSSWMVLMVCLFLIQRGLDGDTVSVVKTSLRLEFETGVKFTDFSIILGINYHSTLVCSWKPFWPTHCKAMSLRQKLRRYFFLDIESFPQLSGFFLLLRTLSRHWRSGWRSWKNTAQRTLL